MHTRYAGRALEWHSRGRSNPTISTKIIAGRIPDGEIYLFVYGFVLAVKIASGR